MIAEKLRIKTLGGLSIERGGEIVDDFASRKAQALLVYLACTGQEHPREVLADFLWDDRSQRQALANLRVVLSSLRRAVAPFVSITRSTAAIDDQADVWLDAALMERAVEAVQEEDSPLSSEAAETLQEVLALYEGDFLAGFFLPEAAGFEVWASGERERLHRLALTAWQRLGRRHLAQRDYPAAIASATRLVQLDPLAEAGHRQLMEALARNGQRAEALAQYETCREILAEELSIEPEAETQELVEAIRRDRLGAAHLQAPSPQAVTSAMPDFLLEPRSQKSPETPFLGRQEALAHLQDHLQKALAGKGRPVFISGEAGMGKTTLVREFARQATEAAPELIVALGHSSTLAVGEGAYQPFRHIMTLLCGDVENALAAGDLGPEQAGRLWQIMPLTAQTILQEGPNLAGVFFNGPSLLARLNSALPEGVTWLSELQRVMEQAAASTAELERSALNDQFAAVLRALAREQPLMLILEDLHWADRSTINLLFQLGKGLAPSPIFFLVTYRTEEIHDAGREERPLLEKVQAEFKRDFGDIIVDLDKIGRAEGRAFVDETVDTQPNDLGESFRRALYRHTQGHPLFTIELLRALRQRGDLVRDEDGLWRAATDIAWAELPAQIEGVLEERLGRLPPEQRRILDVAAVQGETFTAQVVAGALGLQEREVVRHLNDTVQRQHRLVYSLDTRRLGQNRLSRFSFRHALFRQFLYDSLEEVERSYLHEDVGRALEELYEGQTEAVVGQLARHFTEAGLAEEGLRYSLQAGDRARLAYAHEEAAGHYENALVFLREKEDHERVARTLMKLGLTYQLALEHGRARRAFEEGFATWQGTQRHVSQGQHPPAPHPFRVTSALDPETLDPGRIETAQAAEIVGQLFDGLIENPEATEIVPGVAHKWEIHGGGQTVTFHLRRDARWSDGHPLTAEDFVLAWRRHLDPARPEGITSTELYDIKGARNYAQGKAPAENLGVRAVDPHTLIVELERPAGPFLKQVYCPIPAHVVRRHGDGWAAPEHLVTNGPFRLVRWRPRHEMVFERNPHYHEQFAGNVQRVARRYVDDGPTAIDLYENEEVDVLKYRLSVQNLRRLRRRYAADYVSAPRLQTIVLCFDVEREPFHDPQVRRALALAIDRQNLADVHLHGLFFPAGGGMVPPGMAGHTPDINLRYNPGRSRDLLARAGYPDGRNFPNVVAMSPGSGPFATIRETVQTQWREVLGLDIDVRPTEWGEPLHDAQLFMPGWVSGPQFDPSYFLETFARHYGYSRKHEDLDTPLARARETVEPQARLALYRRADRLLLQKALLSPLLYGRAHYFVKPWVRGYLPRGMGIRWKDLVIESH